MTMTTEKLAELKRLAESLGGVEFKAETGEASFYVWDSEGKSVCKTLRIGKWDEPRTVADFIAAANPQTILSLIALAERALQPEEGQASAEELAKDMSRPMVDITPPATHRDRWMYEQGRQAERDPRTPGSYASQLALPAGPVPEGWSDDQMIRFAWSVLLRLDTAKSIAERLNDFRRLEAERGHSSPAVAQPVADEREAFELDYAREWHKASAVARRHSIEHLCNELKEMRVGATYGEGNDYLNFKWRGWQARAALCQPAEEKKPHEWSTLRRGYFDVFSDDGTIYTTVFNSLEALSYLENGWYVEEQKPGQPAEEGGKA